MFNNLKKSFSNFREDFVYYYNYFIVNQFIAKKFIIEYKSNLINALFIHLVFTLSTILFGFIFIDQFGYLIDWGFKEYFIFQFLTTIVYSIFLQFFFGFRDLKKSIILGDINLILSKPLNPILGFYLKNDVFPLLFLINAFSYLFLYFYFGGGLIQLFVLLLISFLIFIGSFFFLAFLEGFTFYSLEFGNFLYRFFNYTLFKTFNVFPINLFESNFIYVLVQFFPLSFISIIVTKYSLFLLDPYSLYVLLIKLIFLIIFFSFGTYFLWKFGLKRYNAYG